MTLHINSPSIRYMIYIFSRLFDNKEQTVTPNEEISLFSLFSATLLDTTHNFYTAFHLLCNYLERTTTPH